jgi:hypothetical protein
MIKEGRYARSAPPKQRRRRPAVPTIAEAVSGYELRAGLRWSRLRAPAPILQAATTVPSWCEPTQKLSPRN